MKMSFQKRLTASFTAIFVLLTAGIVVFGQYRTKRLKTEALEERLDAYADMAAGYIAAVRPDSSYDWSVLQSILPGNLRLTWIDSGGRVIYDNMTGRPDGLDNHAGRKEITTAATNGLGTDIRTSSSFGVPYLYFAKRYGDGYLRVAQPYDVATRLSLEPDDVLFYFIIAVLAAGIVFIRYAGRYFGRSIKRLHDFSATVSGGGPVVAGESFTDDELGEVGRQLAAGYAMLKESQERLSTEKERLLQHIHSSAEGICFYRADGTPELYNGLFIQYLNIIGDEAADADSALGLKSLGAVRDFAASSSEGNYFETIIKGGGKEFLVRCNRFEDRSYEIVLNDITRQEKTRRLKKEMTGNIAHELRTPVTSIRGYLETLLETPVTPERQRRFIEKAYSQTIHLSELIRDIGLLTKIEEDPGKFETGPVSLSSVTGRVRSDLADEMAATGATLHDETDPRLTLRGNETLLYSIFRNLTDNAVKYAGQGAVITIRELGRSNGFIHLSLADNGPGIADPEHLNRIFERFYRADEGRTRQKGGSGLGLSIVKNAVAVQGGSISAKNREAGGLEFIITLPVS